MLVRFEAGDDFKVLLVLVQAKIVLQSHLGIGTVLAGQFSIKAGSVLANFYKAIARHAVIITIFQLLPAKTLPTFQGIAEIQVAILKLEAGNHSLAFSSG